MKLLPTLCRRSLLRSCLFALGTLIGTGWISGCTFGRSNPQDEIRDEPDGQDDSSDEGGPPDTDGRRDGGDGHDQETTDNESKPWHIGSPETLEIVTWNIQEFPLTSQTPTLVAQLIGEMDVDLVAVQEIASVTAFDTLLQNLPSHAGMLSNDEYSPGQYQKTGFVYRMDLLTPLNVQNIFESDYYAFPRPPLQADFDMSLPGDQHLLFTAIVVHLKAYEDEKEKRRAAIERLKTYIDQMLQSAPLTKVVLLGDFNDNPGDPEVDNVFTLILNDPDHYLFLTKPLVDAGDFSYIPYHGFLDHLIMTGTMGSDYQDGRTEVIPLEQQIQDFNYLDVISDHRPVASIFLLQNLGGQP